VGTKNEREFSTTQKSFKEIIKTESNNYTCNAHFQYGYRLKEIAYFLKLHYTTFRKTLKDDNATENLFRQQAV